MPTRDPVCGMTVGPDAATVEGRPEFGFCSEHCRRKFIADPELYLEKNTDEHRPRNRIEVGGLDHLDVPSPGAGDDRLTQRVLRTGFCRGSESQNLVLVEGVEHDHVGEGRLASGDGAGLVQHHGVDPMGGLQGDAILGALPDPHHQ